MTLTPWEEWHKMQPASGPPLEPNIMCSVPGCNRRATDGHHIWARSFTSGPKDWVRLDGLLVANKTWLCVEHHLMITGDIGGHKAWIQWVEYKAQYWWCERDEGDDHWHAIAPLSPQPPGGLEHLETFEAEEPEIADHICPECGKVHKHRHKKKPGHDAGAEDLEHLPARPKSRFQIMVPVDAQEDGVEVLFALLDGLRKPLHTEHQKSHYYTLVKALVLLTQHIHLLTEGEE